MPLFVLCLGLCLGQGSGALVRLLPKPSLQALPSRLVPLREQVTLSCQPPMEAELYRLEKMKTSLFWDQKWLRIPAMRMEDAGPYRCLYRNGSHWSDYTELNLVATGVHNAKPLLAALPGPVVSPGENVTLQCQSRSGFNQYALSKDGDTVDFGEPHWKLKGMPTNWLHVNFFLSTVTAADSGVYRCYSFFTDKSYYWSMPSDPVELVVRGSPKIPSQLTTEPPSSTTVPVALTESAGKTDTRTASLAGPSRSLTVPPQGPTPPPAPPGQTAALYTTGNTVRLCLGAALLLLLTVLLVEELCRRTRTRTTARPQRLPPLPPAHPRGPTQALQQGP